MKNTSYLCFFVIVMGVASSCGESTNDTCLSGTFDCSCMDGSKCDFGLTCEYNVCVEKTLDTGTQQILSDTDTGLVTDTGSVIDTDTGSVTDTDTGSVTDTDTGSVIDTDTGTPDTDTAPIEDTDSGTGQDNEACHVAVKAWDSGFSSNENSFLSIVNQKRAAGATCGSTPYGSAGALSMNPELQCANRFYVYDMGTRNYGPNDPKEATCELGATAKQRALSAGFDGTFMAWGSFRGQDAANGSAATVVDFLMTQPNQCKHLMDPAATYLGVGYGKYAPYHIWAYGTGR